MTAADRTIQAITDDKTEAVLKWLVQTNSVCGNEGELGLEIHRHLRDLGIDAELYEVDARRYNVIATLGRDLPRSLMFHAHMDTVGVHDLAQPFEAQVANGVMYGRGTADIKGGVAAMLLAAGALKQAPKLAAKIILAFAVDEETNARGTYDLLARGIRADAAIALEPSNLHVCVEHAGCLRFQVTTRGRGAHGCRPWAGVNAVDLMNELISDIRRLPLLSQKGRLHNMLPAMNMGFIQGGVSPWVVPYRCEAGILFHFFAEHRCDRVVAQLQEIIDAFARRRDTEVTLEVMHGSNGFALAEDTPLVQQLQQNVARVTGTPKPLAYMPTESDGEVLHNTGGIPTVLFGPGDIDHAHSYREQVQIVQVTQAARVLCLTALGQ